MKKYFVTGGAGFIGSAVVRRLVGLGHPVVVLDDTSRGRSERLSDLTGDLRIVHGDVRDPAAVATASQGADCCIHLAAVNGTENFYKIPDRVLDVGIRGMLSVMDGCAASGVPELIIASSSEVYHEPARIPTPEPAALTIPDPYNPRYSYSACKIASEMLAIHVAPRRFRRVLIVRPHNVYGPDMGYEHVIPQFAVRAAQALRADSDEIALEIRGDGSQTRAFIFIEDFVDGFLLVERSGENLGTYHIGVEEELRIDRIAELVCRSLGKGCTLRNMPSSGGEPARRCPDTAKLRALGFKPRTGLEEGVARTVAWYAAHTIRP
jgi:dTDP-glucose 4,6-dehydratase/UDP-glucose 4-epimerase